MIPLKRLGFNFITLGAVILIMTLIWYLPERVLGKLGILLSLVGIVIALDQFIYGGKK